MRREVDVAPQAARDIAEIIRASRIMFGDLAADRYGLLLSTAIETLAVEPAQRTTKPHRGVRRGASLFHLRNVRQVGGDRVRNPRHVFVYTYNADVVRIIIVLHEAMGDISPATPHLEIAPLCDYMAAMTALTDILAEPSCPIPDIARADMDAAVEAARVAVGLPVGSRIVAAMSGGVDSTVVAALLHKAGYDVVGVTLQLYDHGAALKKKGACCAGQDIHDARLAAETLGIPHYVLDYESRFRDAVIDQFADSYLRGQTPVPCIRCNQTVKFRDLLDVARDLGAAAMATGHYVGRATGPDGRVQMRKAVDHSRDQSYFLFATTPDQLDYLRFPLAGLAKPVVRGVAAELGLKIAAKPDSQDICFVPSGDYRTLIDRLRPQGREAGEIVHMDGRVLGRHGGITDYTIGQRRGLNVAVGEPLFVIRLDPDRRRVVVGPREALLTASLTLDETNWLGDQPSIEAAAEGGAPVLARVRSTRPPSPARLTLIDGGVGVAFDTGEEGVAPGQACALYDPADPDRLLGGGFIQTTTAQTPELT